MNRRLLGVVGTATIVATMVVAIRFDALPFSGGQRVDAEFAEVGNLTVGDDVMTSGVVIGTVSDMRIDEGRALVSLDIADRSVEMGERTRARIITYTLLGEAAVELLPEGEGRLDDGHRIPLALTTAPYDITQALSQLTTEVEGIDVTQLAQSLTEVSDTFSGTPDDVGAALDGITTVASTIRDREAALTELLARASSVTGVLDERNAEVVTLLTSGQALLVQLNDRQEIVVALLDSAIELSDQLQGFVAENEEVLRPALDEVTTLIATLNANKTALQDTIEQARNYSVTFGEAVSSGPFFDAFIPNLTSPSTLAPILSGVLQ